MECPLIGAYAVERFGSMEPGCLLELAWALTPLGNEAEAAATGQRANRLASSRKLEASTIEALLHTATAMQYLGDVHTADELFREAIDRVHETGHTEHLHYLLHHCGRLMTEQHKPDNARTLFEEALRIRNILGDTAMSKSTEVALNELDSWSIK